MIKWGTILFAIGVLLASCSKIQKKNSTEEDLTAKQMLQGIWVDDETDMPLIRINGDTIYYADSQNASASFKVIGDSIYLQGSASVAYKIDRQSEDCFWFHSLSDEMVKLHRSENEEDLFVFTSKRVEPISTSSEIIKKDSIVMYAGNRYHGYVYINPSKIRVAKTSYSGDGLSVENIYYDNIIHICVYQGKQLLYGKDIKKQLFSNLFSVNYLQQVILSDMNFMGIDDNGFHYQAMLSIPESYVSNLINLTINKDKKLIIHKVK